MVTIGSVVVAAGWLLLGIAKPRRVRCHLVVSTAFSTVIPYGNVPVTRGVQQDVNGVRKKNHLPFKAYPVLYKVFRLLNKAIFPLSTMSQTDRAISASGTSSKPPGPTSSRPLVSSRALRRSSGWCRAVKRLRHLSPRRCG